MEKDNIVQFKKAVEGKGNETTGDLLEAIVDALGSVVYDDAPLVDVMESLAVITTLMARDVGISATTLMVCFAKTVEQIYEEE